MMKKRLSFSLIAGFGCCMFLAVVISGCTTTTPSTQTPGPTSVVPFQTSIPPTIVPTGQAPDQHQVAQHTTTVQTTVLTTQSNEPVTLQINRAEKQTQIYIYTPSQGRIFLVLDISIINNGIPKGFDVSDTSVMLTDLNNRESQRLTKSANQRIHEALKNPFLYPTRIPQGEMRSGQIVFGVQQNSDSYKLNLTDFYGKELSTTTITVD